MTMTKTTLMITLSIILFLYSNSAANVTEQAFEQADKSAEIAGYSLSKVHRWLHEKALKQIDPATKLYKADGKWNYRDTAADCYPFLVWAAHAVDQEVLDGPRKASGRVEISWETLVENETFEPWHWQITEDGNAAYAAEVADNLPVYRLCAHPHWLLSTANRALTREYQMPAWIHVGSEIRHREILKVGDTVEVSAVLMEKWRKKGHEFLRLYVAYRKGQELTTEICPRCNGQGRIRDTRSLALAILRVMEEECLKERSSVVRAMVPLNIASFLLNEKRQDVADIERRTGTHVVIVPNDAVRTPPDRSGSLRERSERYAGPWTAMRSRSCRTRRSAGVHSASRVQCF